MNINILTVLLVILVVLKCAGILAISWPIALLPLWLFLLGVIMSVIDDRIRG